MGTKDADTSTFLGGDEHGWGFIGDRALYTNRRKIGQFGKRFSQGDKILVTYDADVGTLEYSLNGHSLGVAFRGLVGELFPAIAMYNRGQRVRMRAVDIPGANVRLRSDPRGEI